MQPRDRMLASLALLLVLILSLSCDPNPQPEGLTPIPTLAPAATLTLVPSLEGGATPSGEQVEPSAVPASGDPESGAAIFAANCVACHGEGAAGGSVGPTLISGEIVAREDDFYRQVISNGRQGTAMPAWSDRLSSQDIEDVIAFLRSVQ